MSTIDRNGQHYARGKNGQVSFDGRFVTISRKGLIARMGIGKGEKRMPIGSINAVQWKPAGPIVNGFIQFTVGGGVERRSRMGHQTASASGDENSVIFAKHQQPQFVALRAAIEGALAALSGPNFTPRMNSSADELERLLRLRQSGALTDSEFAAAKARLLNL